MRFGTTMAQDSQRSGGEGASSDRWIKNLKKGDTVIHFLDDLNEWTPYWEHFNQAKQRSYPCTGNKNTCPGCTSADEREARASKRYLTNALVGDYVDLYKIPVSLINKVTRRFDQDEGTLLKRDFLIVKTGSGLQTEYDMDRETARRVDRAEYADKMQDHQEALKNAYIEAWGELPDEESEAEAPQAKKAAPRKAAAKPAPVVVEGDPGDPPSEPQAQQDQGAEEDEEILSEDEIRAMNAAQLLSLYERVGIAPPDTADAAKLADALIDALSE